MRSVRDAAVDEARMQALKPTNKRAKTETKQCVHALHCVTVTSGVMCYPMCHQASSAFVSPSSTPNL